MRLSIPSNWDIGLIHKIKKDNVEEIYGKLARDVIGGGRVSFILPQVSKESVRKYIATVHSYKLKFNYLLNSTCLGNMEWSRRGQINICKLLDWLQAVNVDSVTVSVSYLLQLIKKRYPEFKVNISTQAGVSTIEEAKFWEDLGADKITLSVHKVNRDFKLLEAIRKNLKCKLQLIANLHCLKNCPFWLYHSNCSSHSSQLNKESKRFSLDYSFIMCSYLKLKQPENLIRSEWIRPEDLHYYQDIGIDMIKLVNRTMSTERIQAIVEAYTNQRYDGNLLDLFSHPSRTFILQKPNLLYKFRYFFRPFSVNLFRLIKAKKLIKEAEIYIDNRALDGFLEYFLKNNNCNLIGCAECKYCDQIAKKVIKIKDQDAYKGLINEYDKFLNQLISGKMFNWF